MSWYDFKNTLADRPFTFMILPRESGKMIALRKRTKEFIYTKLGYKGIITKIELDEFVLKTNSILNVQEGRITKCLKCVSSQK